MNLQQQDNNHMGLEGLNENNVHETHVALVRCLRDIQSQHGFYHSEIKFIYMKIAGLEIKRKFYDRAVTACRTYFRIARFLSNDINQPILGGPNVISLLKKVGMIEEEIQLWDSNLKTSLCYENIGNALRNKGDYEKAIFHYKNAIDVENNCIGNGICISLLWRKIAILTSIKLQNSINVDIDWTDVDKINNGNFISTLPSCFSETIKSGDYYYELYAISEATEHYKRAATVLQDTNDVNSNEMNMLLLGSSSSTSSSDSKKIIEMQKILQTSMSNIQRVIQFQNDKNFNSIDFHKLVTSMATIQNCTQLQQNKIESITPNLISSLGVIQNVIGNQNTKLDSITSNLTTSMTTLQNVIQLQNNMINKIENNIVEKINESKSDVVSSMIIHRNSSKTDNDINSTNGCATDTTFNNKSTNKNTKTMTTNNITPYYKNNSSDDDDISSINRKRINSKKQPDQIKSSSRTEPVQKKQKTFDEFEMCEI